MNHLPPAALVARLVALLDVEELDRDLFRGPMTHEPWERVFGGQVVAQALVAASRTVPASRLPHSLHAYFMRPGDPQRPIIYRVYRDRDGGSFSTRRVVARQNGEPIFNLACSFQIAERGYAYQARMPEVPPPESLPEEHDLPEGFLSQFPENRHALMRTRRALEFRCLQGQARYDISRHPAEQSFWFRTVAPLPRDAALHRMVLAYASDMMLISTCLFPHDAGWNRNQVQDASLDHALWLHGDADADDWLLYSMDSPWTGNARGLARGQIFTRAGQLVAEVVQEGLIRPRQ